MPFSEETVKLLFENRVKDSRDWFLEHRGEYDALCLEPMRRLVTDLAPALEEIDPRLMREPKVGRCISRIYRDTRFSRDKSIFKDVIWCVFVRDKGENLPGYWFELSPRGGAWGCGWYRTDPPVMESARELMLSSDSAFKRAKRAYERQSVFLLDDNRYKRGRFPEAPQDLRLWLEQRSLCFTAGSREPELLFSDTLWERLSSDFRLLRPEYEFMLKAQLRAKK